MVDLNDRLGDTYKNQNVAFAVRDPLYDELPMDNVGQVWSTGLLGERTGRPPLFEKAFGVFPICIVVVMVFASRPNSLG